MMSIKAEISGDLQDLLKELLQAYEERVPAEGAFNDVRARRQTFFGDPATTSPGVLELTIMSMDEALNPANRMLRFLAVRVKKSARGGSVSCTCFHGTKDELKAELERELRTPDILVERVEELASGLPEETNPGLWR